MRLLGKYTFERLRDAFQGIFCYQNTQDDTGIFHIIELWQIRFVIAESLKHEGLYLEVLVNPGPNQAYRSFGKIYFVH